MLRLYLRKPVTVLAVLAVLVGATLGGCARQSGGGKPTKIQYPTRPITVLEGYPPGGGIDIMVNMVRPGLEKILKTSLVPEYKPGASSEVMLVELAKAKPDGYTIGAVPAPPIYLNCVQRQTAYKLSDFTYIGTVQYDPVVLVVRKDSPLKTIQDLVKAAKDQPGKVRVANVAATSSDGYGTALFEQATGIKLTKVHSGGDGPSVQAVLGGHVEVGAVNASVAFPLAKSGDMRVLAVMGDQRLPWSDAPACVELGWNVEVAAVRGFLAPKDTPPDVVRILADALKQVVESDEIKQKAAQGGWLARFVSGEEWARELADQEKLARQIWPKLQEAGK